MSEHQGIRPVFDHIDSNNAKSLDALKKLVRQPSVSAKGEGIEECANLVLEMLQDLGASPRILRVDDGNPLIVGEIRSKSNPKKTLLFYNHYDVQPPEPLDEWFFPPFEPTEKEGKLYGRGVSDDKAELVGRVSVTKAFLETWGDVPCNFKFLFEGEEEIGSTHLHDYVKRFPDAFKAHATIWEFGGVDAKERPQVVLGVKGIFYVELRAKNANRDVHSSLGAIVDNPAWRLVWALNSLKKGEKILVPGWYDDVKPLTRIDNEYLENWPYPEKEVRKELGLKNFIGGIKGMEVRKAFVAKPTCTICGLYSGYTGPGSKTVLPKEALAKIDFRLVPEQDPVDLQRKLVRHLKKRGFPDIEITYAEGEKAARTSPKEPISIAALEAAKLAFDKKPVVVLSSAGTGPMYLFKSPCVAIGGGHSKSQAHAPNENLRLDLFNKGMKWVAETVRIFAAG
jgi:acetylornithine deacetylase/succinyl-diaminopimelate desuccinylase-like protein